MKRGSKKPAATSAGDKSSVWRSRALALEPSLLVLDEATSALDPVTERKISDNLRRRGVSCLVVAHRLSTIRDADEIIVLEQGRIIERGRHEELMKAGGIYRALLEST